MTFDLEAAKRRCAVADDWRTDTENRHRAVILDGYGEVIVTNCAGPGHPHASTIVLDIFEAMRTDLPAAITEIERLAAQVRELEAATRKGPPPLDVYILPLAIHDMIRDLQDENCRLGAAHDALGQELSAERQRREEAEKELDAALRERSNMDAGRLDAIRRSEEFIAQRNEARRERDELATDNASLRAEIAALESATSATFAAVRAETRRKTLEEARDWLVDNGIDLGPTPSGQPRCETVGDVMLRALIHTPEEKPE